VASNPIGLPSRGVDLVSLTLNSTNPYYGCWKFLGLTSGVPVASVRRIFAGTACPSPVGNPNCI
jgi:hypothetical protein